MKSTPHLLVVLFAAALPFAGHAQTTIPDPSTFGPVAGEREVTLGGSGGSNRDFDESFGGIDGSLSVFLSNRLSLGLRQTVNYANPNRGGRSWNGSTRVALDQHFGVDRLRPFIGVNLGGVYGDAVRDTWAAGLEGGVKYYVKPKTFVFARAEYGWFFERAHSLDDRFDDGQITYGAGIGFAF